MTHTRQGGTWAEDFSWTEFERSARDAPFWILATGSTEQHGPHLPLLADSLVAERASELLSEKTGSIIIGSVRVGVMHAYADWPGSQAIDAQTFMDEVLSRCSVALPYARRVIVINGHDENHEPLVLAMRSLTELGFEVLLVEWAHLVSDVMKEVSESMGESHAGEGLTSVMLHWYPTKVRTNMFVAGGAPRSGLASDDLHLTKHVHRAKKVGRDEAPSGILGDPRKATRAKGELIAEALIARLHAAVVEQGWV